MSAEARLAELELRTSPGPQAGRRLQAAWSSSGNMAYVSGHGPLKSDKTMLTGRVGADVDLQGRRSARRGKPAWRFWPRCATTSAASTTSCASSRCWAWSTARPTSRNIRK